MSLTRPRLRRGCASLFPKAALGMTLLALAGRTHAQITPACDRIPRVRDAIVQQFRAPGNMGGPDCDAITEEVLTRWLSGLDLTGRGPPWQDLLTLEPGVFEGLAALEWIYLQNNDLTTLEAGVFEGLTALRWLQLQDNDLTTLEPGLFEGLTALRWLQLQDNDLTALEAGLFEGLTALKWLSLQNNDLTTLEPGLFEGLTVLETLYLYDNGLTTLEPGLFGGLSSLKTLWLHDNHLTTLEAGLFEELTALEELYLYSNDLTTLEPGVFEGLSSLKWLYLYNNDLMMLEPGLFDGLTGLEKLWLQNNRVDPLPITISLEWIGEDGIKARANTGAPFDIVLPLRVANGTIVGGASHITIPAGRGAGDTLRIAGTAGAIKRVTVDIGPLPQKPRGHRGYALVRSADLPLAGLRGGLASTRTVVEGTLLGATVEGLTVELSRSISGRRRDYAWSGVTDSAGRVTLTITSGHGLDASGYYQARARTPDDEVVGWWHSIPLNRNRRQILELTLGGGWRVVAVEPLLPAEKEVTSRVLPVIPVITRLDPNYPNPFNRSTLIPYRLAAPGPVQLAIYNLLGQPVRTLVDELQDAGVYQIRWDARDQRGSEVAAGVYLARLRYPGGVERRLLLYLP